MNRVRHFSWVGLVMATLACVVTCSTVAAASDREQYEYRVLSAKKTPAMEKELEEAAALGFGFAGMADDGSLVIVQKKRDGGTEGRFQYKLLKTKKNSTLEKEMNEAAALGFGFAGMADGGLSVIMRKKRDGGTEGRFQYKLLKKKNSTLEKEMNEAATLGFGLAGTTSVVTSRFFSRRRMIVLMQKERGGVEGHFQYQLVAARKKELKEAAQSYRFVAMSGYVPSGLVPTAIMQKKRDGGMEGRFQYKLLKTKRTSTMEKEMQELAVEGFRYRGLSAKSEAVGGGGPIGGGFGVGIGFKMGNIRVLMERDANRPDSYEYKLLKARESLQEDLNREGEAGFKLVGAGLSESLLILQRTADQEVVRE